MVPSKVLIIGAGKIGAFFDSPQDEHVLTHAHAFSGSKDFCIAGFVDTDLARAQQAAGIWGGLFFSDVQAAFKNIGAVDVVVVATPDATHESLFQEICRHSPKLVFMEKPLGKTLDEIRRMNAICLKSQVAVLVNYSRRFVKEFQALHERIKQGVYGAYVTGTGYYGKGVLHNGSHMTDLVRLLIGEIKDAECLASIRDFYKDDPSISARLNLGESKSFYLQAVDARVATVFELDLFFEKVRIKVLDSGFKIEEFRIAEDPVYKGYKVFQSSGILQTSLDQAFSGAIKNIEGHLLRGEPLMCTIQDGYRAAEISLNLIGQVSGK